MDVQFSSRLNLLSMPLPQCGLRAAESSGKPGHSKHTSVSLHLFIFLYFSKSTDTSLHVLFQEYLQLPCINCDKNSSGGIKAGLDRGCRELARVEGPGSSRPQAPSGPLSSVAMECGSWVLLVCATRRESDWDESSTGMAILILFFQRWYLYHRWNM